ncbi:WxL domain-containing protein [Vagococcus sp. DIV0080]|uniref:WxL domain-containing protein n=1 Tax=Candidatus Vagococcus giribetii TaxID=2230876 RepID=A0ABS3HUA0_9ENTE|nr:WxL domain-containing protein [Vagococcus sp. DIV0080]MBO0477331.1 WxL domain-containing protein [Vagococcus sp. DIV0080]
MKNYKKIVTFLSLSLMGLAINQTITSAAPVEGKTDGKIKFTEGDGPIDGPIELIKPGTEKELITIDKSMGNRTAGGLRLSFVPNFNFGQGEISVTDQVYYAKTIPYKLSDPASSQTEQYMPPFLQVINESGDDHQFSVYVWATTFKSSTHELIDSRIKLANLSGRNTMLDKGDKGTSNEGYGNIDAVAANYLSVPNLSSLPDKALTIPTKQSDATIVFSSANGEKTRGSASSIVFGKDYSPKKVYGKDDVMESVSLHVPATDKPKKADYVSTITWELEDTIR